MVHDAILEATRCLLVSSGYAGVSMDKVAAHAGVGTQTVYRRWPSKGPLVAEAVMQAYARADFSLPDSGDTVADLRTWMHDSAALNAASDNVALIRALAASAAENLQDRDTLYGQLTGRFHDALCQRLRAGISRGQVRADADIDAAADALLGAMLYRALSVTAPLPETLGRYDGLIETVMHGLSNRPDTCAR